MKYVVTQPQPCVNSGDNATDPRLHFDWLGEYQTVSFLDDIPEGGNLVVSGGGIIMDEQVNQSLHRMIAKSRRAVVWGPGLQYPYARNAAKYPDWISGPLGWLRPGSHVLFGLRDSGMGTPWVPCVSCMHQFFDAPPEPTREVVAYFGSHVFDAKGMPSMRNNAGKSVEDVLRFLASGDKIVTSSYHGMVWGCLLGRRVIVIPAMDNAKFYHWPFTHVSLQPDIDWRTAEAPKCAGALEYCRQKTVGFAERAEAHLRS